VSNLSADWKLACQEGLDNHGLAPRALAKVARIATIWILYLLLLVISIVIYFVAASMVGTAARRKDRSFASFFWLSVVLGVALPALVIAALPFREDDPRHPNAKRA
jgi:hypothetical protein